MDAKRTDMKDELLELLLDLANYMDDRSDVVDGNSGRPVANLEMLLFGRIIDIIPKIEKI
jgi:hypothetical protein